MGHVVAACKSSKHLLPSTDGDASRTLGPVVADWQWAGGRVWRWRIDGSECGDAPYLWPPLPFYFPPVVSVLLWPPCVADADIIFLRCRFYLSFFFLA